MSLTKLYCYVDETGQDTKGEFFLVAVILKEINELAFLETKLKDIERKTGKGYLKWKKTNSKIRNLYLKELIKVNELKNSIFYSHYHSSKEYSRLTSLTIAKAVLMKNEPDYLVTILIDGLNNKEREVVRLELKKLRIKYRKIRGIKDEQSVFLRLADTMAGFLRDSTEGENYTKPFVKFLQGYKIITQV